MIYKKDILGLHIYGSWLTIPKTPKLRRALKVSFVILMQIMLGPH